MPRIMVVEDELLVGFAYAQALEAEGHEVWCSPNGAAALAAVEAFDPDVILTDCQMPKMSGVEMARALKRDPRRSRIPIVLVSGHSQGLAPADVILFDAILKKPASDGIIAAQVAGVARPPVESGAG